MAPDLFRKISAAALKPRSQLRAINLPKQATFRQLIAAPNQKIR
jgi:hypothetical protein